MYKSMITVTQNDIEQMVLEAINCINNRTNINEGFTSTVYHFTTIANLVKISKTGKIFPDNGNRTDKKMNNDAPFYFSFTRDRNSRNGYAAYKNGEFDAQLGSETAYKRKTPLTLKKMLLVRIEFDGERLNNFYKGKSVNYYNYPNRQNPISKLPRNNQVKYSQAEDRLLSQNAAIPLFSIDKKTGHFYKPLRDLGIIKKIDIFFPEQYRTKENEELVNLIKWLINSRYSLLKDKISVYDDRNAYDIKRLSHNINHNNLDDKSMAKIKLKDVNANNKSQESTPEESTFTVNTAKRLFPVIAIYWFTCRKYHKKVDIRSVVDGILSFYKKTVSSKRYRYVKQTILKSINQQFFKNNRLNVKELEKVIKNFNPQFLKNSFVSDLLPIRQKAIEIFDFCCEQFGINEGSIKKTLNALCFILFNQK